MSNILLNICRRFTPFIQSSINLSKCVKFSCNYNLSREVQRDLSCGPFDIHLLNCPKTALYTVNKQLVRYKKTKSAEKSDDSDSEAVFSDDDDDDDDPSLKKDSKVMIINLTSLRVDGILKSALGTSRNKIDLLFYESKIRINGKKVLKKSASISIGDEVDLIKGPCPINPNNIIVSRVHVLNAVGKEDKIVMKVRRFKTLTIENYKESKNADDV